jgi:hypothetical protein
MARWKKKFHLQSQVSELMRDKIYFKFLISGGLMQGSVMVIETLMFSNMLIPFRVATVSPLHLIENRARQLCST